jgi:hypothetical protein
MSAEFLYSASVSMSKFSVLFLYRRIFSAPSRSKIYLNILFFLVAGYWVSVYFVLLFAYNPVYAQWQPWLRHTNVKEREFYVAFGIINSTLDIAVLAYPQTRVWKLHISRRRKIFVSLAFLLGGL